MKRLLGFLLAVIFLLTACSSDAQTPEADPEPDPDVTTLIYGKLSESTPLGDKILAYKVNQFNKAHAGEVQMEIKDYTKLSEGGKQGVTLFLTEMLTGEGPDIIDLGSSGESTLLSYRRLVDLGYLEDLWPYLNNDPFIGRNEDGELKGIKFEAPLKAAEINGGLYCAFGYFDLHTLTGDRSMVGDYAGWTPEDMLEVYAAMPDGATILEDYENWNEPSVKEHFLRSILYGFSDMFVDWETGKCSFDGEQFRSLLDLASRLPDQKELKRYSANRREAEEEHTDRLRDGYVMVEDCGISIYSLQRKTYGWGFDFNDPVHMGYPVGAANAGGGSYFEPTGDILAMSSTCRDKEAAWEFIRQVFLLLKVPDKKTDIYVMEGVSLGKKSYSWDARQASMPSRLYLGNEKWVDRPISLTKEQREICEALYAETTRCSILTDTKLVELVMEPAGAYFAGDKSLDDAVRLIQSRAELYINEQR